MAERDSGDNHGGGVRLMGWKMGGLAVTAKRYGMLWDFLVLHF